MHVRWFRNPCRRKNVLCLLTFICLTAGCVYTVHWIRQVLDDMNCSKKESISLLQGCCHQYQLGFLVGELCSALCNDKLIKYLKCTNYRHGKHVFVVDCHNFCIPGTTVKAVLKTKNRELYNFDKSLFQTYLRQYSGSGKKAVTMMIKNILRSELSDKIIKENDTDVVRKFWNGNYKRYLSNSSSLLAFARSLVLLVEQSEYRMLKMNQALPYFPRIYGTCGPLYLVEYSPPGDVLEHDFSLLGGKKHSFYERAVIAMRILDLVYRIDRDLPEQLHLCDVKGENFGISQDGVKLIDVDTVFYDSMLKSIIAGQNCTTHQDCYFFDCAGLCNLTTGLCENLRTNNNLQSVCEDVFLSKWMNTIGGLLRNPPSSIQEKLQSLLYTCAFAETRENGISVHKPSTEFFLKLYNLLLNTVQKLEETADLP